MRGPGDGARIMALGEHMKTLQEFITVYKLYRVVHSRRYALGMAYNIAFRGLPF